MKNRYELSTIADILALEQDQIERFCEELPRITAYIKSIQALVGLVAESAEVDQLMPMVMPLTWIDDGKKDMTVEITANGESMATLEVKKETDQ